MKRILEKIVLLEVKGLIQIIVTFRAEKALCTFLSPNILLRGIKYWLRKQLCSFENERLILFSYTIWFMISEKNITRCLFLHRGACMHQKSQRGMQKMWTSGFYSWTQVYTYRRTRRQEFQNILERKLCHCFGQYWKMLNMNLNMILIVLLIGEIRLLEIPEMYSKFYEDLSI